MNSQSLKRYSLVFALPIIMLAFVIIQLTPLIFIELGALAFIAPVLIAIGVLQIVTFVRFKALNGFLLALKYVPTFAFTAFFALMFIVGAFEYGGFSMSLRHALAFAVLAFAALAHIPLFVLEIKRLIASKKAKQD